MLEGSCLECLTVCKHYHLGRTRYKCDSTYENKPEESRIDDGVSQSVILPQRLHYEDVKKSFEFPKVEDISVIDEPNIKIKTD